VEIPLKIHIEENMFKLYFFDVGLLCALAELPLSAFGNADELFKTFKGAIAENFFLQEFRAARSESLYCWQGKTAEVDFLFNKEMELYPVEVKSGKSGKLKSLSVFCQKYPSAHRTRCSLLPFEIREDTKMRNFPLYLAGRI
jgi:predicted AAA+ superfamily ATPase